MSITKTMNGGLEVVIDPNDAYTGIKPTKLLDAAGLLPYFVLEAALTQPESVQEAFDLMEECYGMPTPIFPDTSIDGGVWVSKHDEDEDLQPMLEFKVTEEILGYVYQYAFVAITDGEDTICFRMD